jgi:hypothetical protein
MLLKAILSVKSVDEARNIAIEWQRYASEAALSYSELAEFGEYFEILAKKFDLTEEFHENGII